MSGDKVRGNQSRDTTTKDTILQHLESLHHSHREVTRLFLMVIREGDTDTQIDHVLREGLPHLTDPVSLQDRHSDKQPEDIVTSEKVKQPVAQQTKRTHTTGPRVKIGRPLTVGSSSSLVGNSSC